RSEQWKSARPKKAEIGSSTIKAYFSWEPPGKIRLLGFSLVLWDIPELPIQQTKFPGRGVPDFLQIRMGKGFSSTNFVHWINGVESDSKGQQAGPDPDAKCDQTNQKTNGPCRAGSMEMRC